MTIRISTSEHGAIVAHVATSRDAVRLLRDLAASGVKCIKWEVA